MLKRILLVYHQVREARISGGLKEVFRPRFFWKRKATPVEMDLTALSSSGAGLQDSRYHFLELKRESLAGGQLSFTVPSRGLKAPLNHKRGWRGFAIVEGNMVIADVWCATPREDGTPVTHSDLAMLGITCGDKDVYAFDMYISPTHRGENLAAPFERCLHATLKSEGYDKVYGYYWDDNVPALWMHRILRFKELPKRQVSRFLFYLNARTITNTGSLPGVASYHPTSKPRSGIGEVDGNHRNKVSDGTGPLIEQRSRRK